MVRLLAKEEYFRTIPLFTACFGGDEEFMQEYYGDSSHPGAVFSGRIAVREELGEIVSMVHLKPVLAVRGNETLPVTYIMGVATHPDFRHRGYMDEVMGFVLDLLRSEGAPWCFLIAVDKEIYRHLGFLVDWRLTPEDAEMLYADDGLEDASGCLLGSRPLAVPEHFQALP